jgi:excisionase family DNA binding protein
MSKVSIQHELLRHMRTDEAANYLRLSRSTLEKMRLSGDGPPFIKSGKRIVLYKTEDLEQWLESRKVQSTSEA